MKKIWSIIGVMILLLSCSRVERIQSLSQLESALRKHVGNPSKIDTIYKSEHFPYSGIQYLFEVSSDVSFEQLTNFLSSAYDCKPKLIIEKNRQVADFKSESEKNPYELQILEYYSSKDNKRYLDLMIIDINNELVTPSSQTPQTSALSK